MESKFYCEKCNYRTDIASCYKQHLETTLHKTGKRKERCDKTLYKCNKCSFENYFFLICAILILDLTIFFYLI